MEENKKNKQDKSDSENEKYIVVKIESVKNKEWNIKIYISKTTMYPGKSVSESNGAKVEIIFKSYAVNPLLDKNMFKLNVSDEVEVIKLN